MNPRLLRILLPLGILAALVALSFTLPTCREPIRIGVVYALSGVMAESERGLVDAVRLAVEEINASGGLLDRPLEMLVADSHSDWDLAAREAERLIQQEGVSALFACWTSACRQALRPVVEAHRHLLFYALQYEGLEQSPHIIYLGAAPNQQIIPGAHWAMERFGRRVYLVGSDYVFPRTANRLIRDLVTARDGVVVAETYLPLDASQLDEVAADIRQRAPDLVLSTLNGQSNQPFFAALAAAGLDALPVVSFSLAEPELGSLLVNHYHAAHYTVWGYFQSLAGEYNQRFITAFRQRFGAERLVSDPLVTAYEGVLLWAAAVRESGTDDPVQVNLAIGRQSLAGPSGIVILDAATRHRWRRVYVGQAREDGQFDAREISQAPVRPVPFPPFRSREAWQDVVAPPSAAPAPATPSPPGERP